MATGYALKRPLRDVGDKIKWCDRRNCYRRALQKGLLRAANYEKVKEYKLEDFCHEHGIVIKPPSPVAPKVNTLDNYCAGTRSSLHVIEAHSGKAAQDSLLEST